jgi:hypothetical protein
VTSDDSSGEVGVMDTVIEKLMLMELMMKTKEQSVK